MHEFLQGIVHPPIYLFQMGKVGSSSLKATLSRKYKGAVIHAHNYGMLNGKQKGFLKWSKRLNLPVYVICPVREPLSRNVSAFFQNFKRDTGYEFLDREWSAIELRELFLNHYPHNVCLEWFDKNLRTTFGINVFATAFPVKRKWNTYKKGSIRLLVYRSDLDHSEQLNIVSRFIRCNIDGWIYGNKSAEKEYGEAYRSFCDSVALPDIYISIMCNSLFCRHFWSKEEIDVNSKKWMG